MIKLIINRLIKKMIVPSKRNSIMISFLEKPSARLIAISCRRFFKTLLCNEKRLWDKINNRIDKTGIWSLRACQHIRLDGFDSKRKCDQ